MNRTNLKVLARLYVPQSVANAIDDTALNLVLNEGALYVALKTICLKANSVFTVTANTAEYNLNSVVTRFLVPDRSGLYWNAGTAATTNWKQIKPKTIEWLNKNYTNWRDASSSNPQYSYIESNILRLIPTPDTTLTGGFWFYFGQKPVAMTDDAHYPFGGATEITHLSPLSECVLLYWRWKALDMLDKPERATIAKQLMEAEIVSRWNEIKKREDIFFSMDARLRGRNVPREG